MCVFVALGIWPAMRMRHIVMRGLPRSTVFFHIILFINGTIFKKKKSYWAQNVFLFSVQNLSETFFILRLIERHMTKMYIGLYVKYRLLLSDFNETWIFSTDFRKNPQISNFMKIRPVGAEIFHAEGRTDMTKLKVAFRNFANAPKNSDYFSRQKSLASFHYRCEVCLLCSANGINI